MARWMVLLLLGLASVACSRPGESAGADLGMTAQDLSAETMDMRSKRMDLSTAPVDMDLPPPSKGCIPGDWCWESPLPTGDFLYGVWGTDANNVWAVGLNGTIL